MSPTAQKGMRALALLVCSSGYLAYVFHVADGPFWTAGLGDWIDPYFINFLMEHWYHSARRLADPSSPPMYFPVAHTMGYSHGLVLYAPYYLALRPFLHPFQAYSLALLLLLETGIVCLFVLIRNVVRLSFVESLLLTVFFFTSVNVINDATGIWSQRASVFVIPPILLLAATAARMPQSGSRLALGSIAGLLSTLLFTQDIYTGVFALFFAVAAVPVAWLAIPRAQRTRPPAVLSRRLRAGVTGVALLTTTLAGTWAAYLRAHRGFGVELLGGTITSRDWQRPAWVALVALAVVVLTNASRVRGAATGRVRPFLLAFAAGSLIGGVVFFWIYFDAYREHHAFPEEQLVGSLALRDPAGWRRPWEFVSGLSAYRTGRPFLLVLVSSLLALVPAMRIGRRARLGAGWLLVVSLVVLLIPVRFDEFSIWTSLLAPIPGFSVIRDPRRIIHLYELAAVLATALLAAQFPARSLARVAIGVVAALLLVTDWNRESFEFLRPNRAFDRWVTAPIRIDPGCKSFFIDRGSDEYMSRSDHMWTLYGVDSMFISVNHSIPTLNGYSALEPLEWGLANPQEPGYIEAVDRWIHEHRLRRVCRLDIDRRTMEPYYPAVTP